MYKLATIVWTVCLISGMLSLSACSRPSFESINRDPGQFHHKEITVAGRVINSFNSENAGAFELDDGTGRLWVLRDSRNLPSHNSRATVTGRLEQGFSFGGRKFVVIFRETRKPR